MRKLIVLCFFTVFIAASTAYAGQNPYNQNVVCPVITYHDITEDTANVTEWKISCDKFENDVKTLIANGYTPIFTSDLYNFLNNCENSDNFPEKPIIIQFDDGYTSFYEMVFPILHKYNIKAEVYIITDYTQNLPTYHCGSKFLGWEQLKLMEDSGLVYVGLHGKNHEPAINSSEEEMVKNFNLAWDVIDENLGKHERFYVYPNGLFTAKTLKAFQEAGANTQFIWVWNLSSLVKPYNVWTRAHIGPNTDVTTAISEYNKLLNINIKK